MSLDNGIDVCIDVDTKALNCECGDSIADGVCSTVVTFDSSYFQVQPHQKP